jgi:hypothetical protein
LKRHLAPFDEKETRLKRGGGLFPGRRLDGLKIIGNWKNTLRGGQEKEPEERSGRIF